MAGMVGGGGLGAVAINYGYYRYERPVMNVTIVLLVVLVQLIQLLFSAVVRKVDKNR